MFWSKKPQVEPAANPTAPNLNEIFIQRQRFDLQERAALEDHGGSRSSAIVTGVSLIAEMREGADSLIDPSFMHPPREYEIRADVRVPGEPSFPASIPFFLDEIGDPPAPGEKVYVVFDPANRARVRTVDQWRDPLPGGRGVRWSVPEKCPHCGAPVDQSTESVAEHPMCRMCGQPLPCQPSR